MAVINNPGLNEIALKIVGDPYFSFDEQQLRRAYRRWEELTTPEQRRAAEQALLIRWWQDILADHRNQRPPAVAPPASDRGEASPKVVAGTVDEDEAPAPYSTLKFTSESPEPAPLSPPRPASAAPPRPAVPVPPRTPPPGPVVVQQPSRKVAAYQQMPGGRLFPELSRPVATASGPKALGEFTGADLERLRAQLGRQKQDLQTRNAGDEARIENRETANARDRVKIAQRAEAVAEMDALAERAERAERELAAHGLGTVAELPAEALAACGFRRQVA